MALEILLDCLILTFLAVALLLSIAILTTIGIYFRPCTSNVPILLACNTYFALTLTCVSMIVIYAYNLRGDLGPFVSVNDCWCQLRTYFVNVCFCSLYYSCVLQSIFRLFRVVLYQIKLLQSSQFFIGIAVVQWFLAFSLTLLNLMNDDYEHLPRVYRCWISFENTRGLLITSLIIYGWPLLAIISIYAYIVRYIRQRSQLQHKRQRTMERDLLVLKRITIFVFVVTAIGLPTVSILFVWMACGKLVPMAYHLQGLSMSMGVLIAAICFAFISPHIQHAFHKTRTSASYRMVTRSRQQAISRSSQKEAEDSQ